MWSVPFNFNIHDSYFAVGMIFNRGKFTSSSYWFNQMYYSEKGAYKRGSGGQTITFENSAIVVHAHMEGSTYHPLLNVSVIPQVRFGLGIRMELGEIYLIEWLIALGTLQARTPSVETFVQKRQGEIYGRWFHANTAGSTPNVHHISVCVLVAVV